MTPPLPSTGKVQRQLQEQVYARHPEIRELDREIQATMLELMDLALTHREDLQTAISRVREKNLRAPAPAERPAAGGGLPARAAGRTAPVHQMPGHRLPGRADVQLLDGLLRDGTARELTSLLSRNEGSTTSVWTTIRTWWTPPQAPLPGLKWRSSMRSA